MAGCDGIVGRGKCAALAEPGQRYCVHHLKQAGFTRCETCRSWMAPQPLGRPAVRICVGCAGQPPALPD